MSCSAQKRGAAPVGHITDLDSIEAAAVVYLRMWSGDAAAKQQVFRDFAGTLGAEQGRKALRAFEQLCSLCANHGRRPLMRHSVQCSCLGADESCFANFISAAAEGAREDAMLIATLLVRADIAPLIASCAADFGLALKRMHLAAPRDLMSLNTQHPTLH
ncbi:putative caspase-like protein [Sulfitobacter undariae]|uniref:Putative caspase-like protein n=1 Tax=Sulfitobacter undariae TaxID=1563671 RepID=A0A7W6GYU7_9RHOB|nr:hypothetical protein [Sulfitobacter undariae]MBB3992810.1 putative caspase-like protein [Sulfitobacter undariae]